jgi:hypothetical protein
MSVTIDEEGLGLRYFARWEGLWVPQGFSLRDIIRLIS